MKLIYGHHSELESDFCDTLADIKLKNPLKRILVVSPSARVCRRLEYLLAVKLGHFAGVRFDTFLTLAKNIIINQPCNPKNAKSLPVTAGLRDFLLKNILEKIPCSFYGRYYGQGFVSALLQTVRDMVDARIEPAVILENLPDECFICESEKERFYWLLKVQAMYRQLIEDLCLNTRTDLFLNASSIAKDSRYLKSFDEIFYYGFYDLTGLQLEFFDSIRSNYDTTLYFSYMEKNAYGFAKAFFETHIYSKARRIKKLKTDFGRFAVGRNGENIFEVKAKPPVGKNKNVSIVNVSGFKDEIWCAVKEILKLRKCGFKFEDIALIVPTLEPYRHYIGSFFDENFIPFDCNFTTKLTDDGLMCFCRDLMFLCRNGFEADIVSAIFASPYFKQKNKNEWFDIVRLSGIDSGLHQWSRMGDLKFYEDAGLDKNYCRQIYSWIKKLGKKLIELEKSANWKELSNKALSIIKENIATDDLTDNERNIYERVVGVVQDFETYDFLRRAKEGEFLDELAYRFEKEEISLPYTSARGVCITDMVSARNLSFEALILVGLNEGSFPKAVAEDVFLSDNLRKNLYENLGFRIKPKLDYFGEQKLIFYSLITSARKKLVCVYKRSDDEGKACVPCVYLLDMMRVLNISKKDEVYVARQNIQKYVSLDEELLSDSEMSVKISLDTVSASENYKKAGLSDDFLENSIARIPLITSYFQAGAYDGFVEKRVKFSPRVMSPSHLQILAECPMRYFFANVLKLRLQKDTLNTDAVGADKLGSLYHNTLMQFYSDMKKSNFWESSDGNYIAFLQSAFEKCLDSLGNRHFGLYPLLWQAKKEVMKENLSAFVEDDMALLKDLRPAYFEKEISGSIEGLPYDWTGRIDRIDIDYQNKLMRIVDYKKKRKSNWSENLSKTVLKGELLQPYIYMELAGNFGKPKGFDISESIFSLIEKNDNTDKRILTFSAQDLVSNRDKIKEFISFLISLIDEGAFFIRTDTGRFGWCSYCDFKNICRKNDPRVLARVKKNPLFISRQNYENRTKTK